MKYPKAIINKLNAITEKRPSTVIQHILKYGFITTEELKVTTQPPSEEQIF